ncbi:thiol:disulfide interchange protein DsbA/DsbL [Sulfuriflexus sp.]|uniref:thiol:disulfide interchange protein DsbA/DsbL n=1 Tax=Sulfuriflexus sp. TaxID=2015443 RepID=UPI0028CBE25E|nr:thiol:disulfide interchange protein DsbA/DsbL [Sulfuriflexus sp.]MDT8404816.1 thiol:disulfide interchange protein DsbA/DsbL [Sulfuriflexus sp.]
MKKSLFILFALLGLSLPAAAYDEGFEYKKVTPSQPTTSESKIEVVELFWYGCPHCYDFEPSLSKWTENKPDNVEFIRIPAVFRQNWMPHARAYYTAEALGVLDKTHKAFFDAVHKEKQPLQTEKAIGDFFVKQGVKRDEFKRVWNSFVVQARLKRAVSMTKRYGITGVPAMVVNGKYRTGGPAANINSPAASKQEQHENVLKVVDWLVSREAAAKAGK